MVRVVCVSGVGRSGSSVFEQVLATHPDLTALGEVRALWRRGYVDNVRCGCGRLFRDCPFWSHVDNAAFGGLPQAVAARVPSLYRQVVRHRRIPELLRSPTPDTAELLGYYERVYRAAGDAVVDSTNDPLHAVLVSRIQDASVHVVHLVRDPRGVAHSWGRTFPRADVGDRVEMMQTRAPLRSAIDWSWRNGLAHGLRVVADTYRRVRYEDFVAEPQAVCDGVWADVGLTPATLDTDRDGAIAVPVTHTLWGNPRRQVGAGRIALRVDDEWRSAMSPRDRRLVTALTAPLSRLYRY